MTQLRFHRELYHPEAVAEALSAFAAYAELTRADDDDAIVVEVAPRYPRHARRIVGELQNYALAKTIDRGGAR